VCNFYKTCFEITRNYKLHCTSSKCQIVINVARKWRVKLTSKILEELQRRLEANSVVTKSPKLELKESIMSIEVSGILGFIWLIISVWAIVRTVQSSASAGKKTLWIVFILLLPVIGIVVWFFIGPKR